MAMRTAVLLAAAASASALHIDGAARAGLPAVKLQARSQEQLLLRATPTQKSAALEHLKGGAPAVAPASPLKLLLLITGWSVPGVFQAYGVDAVWGGADADGTRAHRAAWWP